MRCRRRRPTRASRRSRPASRARSRRRARCRGRTAAARGRRRCCRSRAAPSSRPTAPRGARAGTSRARASCGTAPATAAWSSRGRSARAWRRSMPAAAEAYNPRAQRGRAANIAACTTLAKRLRARPSCSRFACASPSRRLGPGGERPHPHARRGAARDRQPHGACGARRVARAAAADLREPRVRSGLEHAAPDRRPARDHRRELSRRARSERLPRGSAAGGPRHPGRSCRPSAARPRRARHLADRQHRPARLSPAVRQGRSERARSELDVDARAVPRGPCRLDPSGHRFPVVARVRGASDSAPLSL